MTRLKPLITRSKGLGGSRNASSNDADTASARRRVGTPTALGGRHRPVGRPTGHVYLVERKRGPAWYAKYRPPDGSQVKKLLGPAWTGRGRPPAGYFTKRLAEDWLRDTLDEARWAAGYVPRHLAEDSPRGELDDARRQRVETGATFADAAAEYLRFAEEDRGCKPSTVRGYRSAIQAHLLPMFGSMALEAVTVREIERWRSGMSGAREARELPAGADARDLQARGQAYSLPVNPVANVDRFRVRSSGDIQVFSPEEIWALVRAATSELDAAIFLAAAFTGLRRGELLALRWRDVDFAGSTIRVRASYAAGHLTTPKSGKVRAVPMAGDVASGSPARTSSCSPANTGCRSTGMR
jgi:integrase